MDNLTFVIACIYFYLPVAMANIGANLGKFIPIFRDIKQPIDFNLKFDGVRIVGDHKYIGSFLFGVLFGTFWGIIKTIYLDTYMSKYLLLNENSYKLIFLYFLMSVAALGGDLIKSIAKRLLKRPPHSPWIPFDEIDHSLASMLIATIFFSVSWSAFFSIIFIFLFLHLITNVIGYLIKVKEVPY